MLRSRLTDLTTEQKGRFLPLCPDFVIELRSPSDSLVATQAKLDGYLANGAPLGWLLDVPSRRVQVYRPDAPVTYLDNQATLSAEPELSGFTLNLASIWDARF